MKPPEDHILELEIDLPAQIAPDEIKKWLELNQDLANNIIINTETFFQNIKILAKITSTNELLNILDIYEQVLTELIQINANNPEQIKIKLKNIWQTIAQQLKSIHPKILTTLPLNINDHIDAEFLFTLYKSLQNITNLALSEEIKAISADTATAIQTTPPTKKTCWVPFLDGQP